MMGDRDTLGPDDFSQAAADRRRGAEPVVPVMTRGELADAKQAAFAEGTRVGRAQAEAEELATYYAGDTLNAAPTTAPTTYDAAVVALEVAGRCVHRIDVAGFSSAEAQQLLVDQHAHGITALADELVRWLSEHIEPDAEPGAGGGRPISELVIDEVVRWPAEQQDRAAQLVREAMTDGDRDGELVEDDDGSPLPPEQQPCPNCLAGKHDNCPGRIPGAGLTYLPCPCAGQTHPESLGS